MNMPALFDLAGRVAVVTGGNGGIGRSIALGLAEAGASVAVFGRNDEKNQHVLSELNAMGVPSIAVKIDLTDRAALEPALSRVETELGGLSILVNNAGNVSLSGGILLEKPEDWETSSRRNSMQSSFSRSLQPKRCWGKRVERLLISAVCTRSLDLDLSPRTARRKVQSSS
jgi:NAD(P)-dependent dehydrogenase (short-subunit alcohol dehydrogenase family)